MKKTNLVILLTLVLVLVVGLVGCANTSNFGDELVLNGNFEKSTFSDGVSKPINWSQAKTETKYSYCEHESSSEELGSKFLKVSNNNLNKGYFYQKINVEPNAIYRVTANVCLGSSFSGSNGAFIGFLENPKFIGVENNTANGEWKEYEMYFTPSGYKNLTLTLSLGSENNLARGTACFDNVSVVKVEKVPVGATLYNVKSATKLPYHETAGGIIFTVFMVLLVILVAYLLYYALKRITFKDDFLKYKDKEKITYFKNIKITPTGILLLNLVIGFILRFIMSMTMVGNSMIIDSNLHEAKLLCEFGLGKFLYNFNTNTSIGYLYYLSVAGHFINAAKINSEIGVSIILKLPTIISDLLIIYVLYNYGRKYIGDKTAGIFSLLYAILPSVFIITSGWGGYESIGLLFSLLTLICILEKKNIWLFVSYFFALMNIYEAIFLAPIILTYLVMLCIKNKKFILNAVLGVIGFIVLYYLLALPFTILFEQNGKAMYIFSYFYNALAESAVFASDTFNLYAIFGLNNKAITTAGFVISIIFVVFIWIYCIYQYVQSKNRLSLVLLSGFMFIMISVFAVNMRYSTLILGIMALMLYAMLSRDKRIFSIACGLSALKMLNIGSLINMAGYIGGGDNSGYMSYAKFDGVLIFGSVVIVLLAFYLLYVVNDICDRNIRKEIQPANVSIFANIKALFKSLKTKLNFNKNK